MDRSSVMNGTYLMPVIPTEVGIQERSAPNGLEPGFRRGDGKIRRLEKFCAMNKTILVVAGALVFGAGFPSSAFCQGDPTLKQKVLQELWNFKQEMTDWFNQHPNKGPDGNRNEQRPQPPPDTGGLTNSGSDPKPTGRHPLNPYPLNNPPSGSNPAGSPNSQGTASGPAPSQPPDGSGGGPEGSTGNQGQASSGGGGNPDGSDQKPTGWHPLDPNSPVNLPTDHSGGGDLTPPSDGSDMGQRSSGDSGNNLLPHVVPVLVNAQLDYSQNPSRGSSAPFFPNRRTATSQSPAVKSENPDASAVVSIGSMGGDSGAKPNPQAPGIASVSGLISPSLGETLGNTTGARGVTYGLSASVLGTSHSAASTLVGMPILGRMVLPLNKPIPPAGASLEALTAPTPTQVVQAGHMVGLDNGKAMQGVREELERNPNNPEAWGVAAAIMLKEKRYPEAEAAARHALQLDADNTAESTALINALMIEGRLGNQEKLEEAAKLAADMAGRTHSPEFIKIAAQAQQDLGHPEKAKALIHSGVGGGFLNVDEAGQMEAALQSGGRIYDPEDRSALHDDVQGDGTRSRRGWIVGIGLLMLGIVAWVLRRVFRRTPAWQEVVSGKPGTSSSGVPSGYLAGKYELVRILGRGEMGEVYEALDHSLGRTVAVKKVRSFGKEAYLKKARDEAAHHRPGAIRTYEILEQGEDAYVVMEYVRGHSLDQFLAS